MDTKSSTMELLIGDIAYQKFQEKQKAGLQSANQIIGGINMSSVTVDSKRSCKTRYEPITIVDIEKLEMTEQPMPDIAGYARIYLEESIKTFGIRNPLRITHDYRIIDGRNRYAIAQELGITRIPCIISDVDKNPMDEALRYHLELGRRSLTKEQHKTIKKECEIFEEELKKDTFKSMPLNLLIQAQRETQWVYVCRNKCLLCIGVFSLKNICLLINF